MVLNTLFSLLSSQTFPSITAFKAAFLLILAGQLSNKDATYYPTDYLIRSSPTFSPFDGVTVADNACQRTIYGSPMVFDFIVVGSGASGSVIAERLSRTCTYKVLLIDAGGDPPAAAAVPILSVNPAPVPSGKCGETNTFEYRAEVSCSSSNAFNGGLSISGQKQFGGASNLNTLLYMVGTDRDYNSWAAAGNPGWDYDCILPLIKRTEGNLDVSLCEGGKYHGLNGPLKVSSVIRDPFSDTLKSAFVKLGYPCVDDFNKNRYNGYGNLQMTVANGESYDAYKAFIEPAKNRPNLFIMKNSLVTKVLFDGNKAIGVIAQTPESACPIVKAHATKETILCTGAFNSPKILLQSGIGKPADLTPLGISVVADLPVGYNLQDRVSAINFFSLNPNAPQPSWLDQLQDYQDYFTNREGPLSRVGLANARAIINTLKNNAKAYPDVEMSFTKYNRGQSDLEALLKEQGYKSEFISALVAQNQNSEILMARTTLLNPKSRGSCKLRSASPNDSPLLNPNYLAEPEDVATLIRGMGKLLDLTKTPAMCAVSLKNLRLPIAECDVFDFGCDKYWKCYLKYFTTSEKDPAGSCKMGPQCDPKAVVNPKLQVKGIVGLRVADASIFPTIISGNSQATSFAVGQKCSDLLAEAWPCDC